LHGRKERPIAGAERPTSEGEADDHEAAKPARAQLPYSYIAKYTERNDTQREDTPVPDPMVSTRMGLG